MTIWTDLLGVDFEVSHAPSLGHPTRVLRAGLEHDEHVIMLHGTSGHLEAFIRNIPSLSEHFALHALDMAGHGFSDNPEGMLRIRRYMDHVLAYMDSRGIDRAHFIGESLGGWVAARLAGDEPDRVGRLILVAPGGSVANPEVMERIKTSTRRAVYSDEISLTRKRLELLMFDAANVSDELTEVRHTIYHRPPFVQGIDDLLCLQEMENRTQDLLTEERMRRIKTPTLIVWGAENPFGAIPEAKRMNGAIDGSRLEIFGECGHWPQHEHADQFNKLALEFLAE
jgi:2-hydroxy-6-oxonona-2,4-dienedioate hydrolase